jgi:hypothetical protein
MFEDVDLAARALKFDSRVIPVTPAPKIMAEAP